MGKSKKVAIALVLLLVCAFCGLGAGEEPGGGKVSPPPSSLPYEYKSLDKIDPFVPFQAKSRRLQTLPLATEEKGAEQAESLLIPTKELKLTGILKKGNELWAILTGSDGRGIFVKEGMRIGKEGTLVSKILFEDRQTPSGVLEIRKVILKVPESKENGLEHYQEIEITMGSSE